VFETVSTGVASNLDIIRTLAPDQLRKSIIAFKQHADFATNTGAGANVKSKLISRVGFARSFFGKT
jgi:hypothetical protein